MKKKQYRFSKNNLETMRRFDSLPRRGCISKPRVGTPTLGSLKPPLVTPKGFNQPLPAPLYNPFGVDLSGAFTNPGCAARPWALGCNPFGVNTDDLRVRVLQWTAEEEGRA